MKLSRRERILLFWAGLTALVSVGLFWVLLPAMGGYLAQRELYEAAVAEESLWLDQLDAPEDWKEEGSILQEEYRGFRELFPDRMDNEEAEGLVLTRLEEGGLKPISSRILKNGPVTLKNGGEQAKGLAACFDIRAEGEMENFISFMEELEEEICMRLISFQAEPDAGGGWRFTMELECYMLEGVHEE